MNKKRGIGFLLFLGSIGMILFGNFSITGGVIGQQTHILPISWIGICLLFVSLIILTSKNSLEAIVIPTGEKGENSRRARVGRNYYSNPENQYFIISGGPGRNKIDESERADIYRGLRDAGYGGKETGKEIKPSQMVIEGRSTDTLHNVLYSLEKLRPGTGQIDFVSYPLHLKKIEMIMDKAREEGLVPGGLKVSYIPTKQSISETVYGLLALVREKYRLRKGIKEAEKNNTGKFGNLIKKLIEG